MLQQKELGRENLSSCQITACPSNSDPGGFLPYQPGGLKKVKGYFYLTVRSGEIIVSTKSLQGQSCQASQQAPDNLLGPEGEPANYFHRI